MVATLCAGPGEEYTVQPFCLSCFNMTLLFVEEDIGCCFIQSERVAKEMVSRGLGIELEGAEQCCASRCSSGR